MLLPPRQVHDRHRVSARNLPAVGRRPAPFKNQGRTVLNSLCPFEKWNSQGLLIGADGDSLGEQTPGGDGWTGVTPCSAGPSAAPRPRAAGDPSRTGRAGVPESNVSPWMSVRAIQSVAIQTHYFVLCIQHSLLSTRHFALESLDPAFGSGAGIRRRASDSGIWHLASGVWHLPTAHTRGPQGRAAREEFGSRQEAFCVRPGARETRDTPCGTRHAPCIMGHAARAT